MVQPTAYAIVKVQRSEAPVCESEASIVLALGGACAARLSSCALIASVEERLGTQLAFQSCMAVATTLSTQRNAERSRNPSRASKRVAVGLFALLGALIAARLTVFQLGITTPPWEPFFGDGTRRVLTSAFSRALPFPDSAFGLFAYIAEALAVSVGGVARWRERRLAVYGYAAIAFGMALGSAGLVVVQAAMVHAFCTLCLASALISFALAVPAASELAAAWKERKRDASFSRR